MNMKKIVLKKLLIASSVLGLTACSLTDKNHVLDEEQYDIDNVVQTNSAIYSCDSNLLSIFFHAEQAQITWKGTTYQLHHAISASGSFYLGEVLSFWIHEGKAELELNNMGKFLCYLVRVDS